jgi:hypothetical protein
MSRLRALSTRAHITTRRFTNTYQWGDFKGSPKKMMEEFFDAHLYVANWGMRDLYLRLPATTLNLADIQDFLADGALEAWEAHGNTILHFSLNNESGGWDDDYEWGDDDEDYYDEDEYDIHDEDGYDIHDEDGYDIHDEDGYDYYDEEDDDDDEEDDDGGYGDEEDDEYGCGRRDYAGIWSSLDALLELRSELACGDLRALYLGWLGGVSARVSGDDGDDGDDDDGGDGGDDDDGGGDSGGGDADNADGVDDADDTALNDVEPPVPPGLGALTSEQLTLVRFLKIDGDVLAAAVAKSAPLKSDAVADKGAARRELEVLRAWVLSLPSAQKDAWIEKIAAVKSGMFSKMESGESESEEAIAELRRAYQNMRCAKARKLARADASWRHATERRTVGALLRCAGEIREARKKRKAEEAARAAAERARKAAEAREKHLDRQAAREHELWPAVQRHIAARLGTDYDMAVAILLDLRDLARRRGKDAQVAFVTQLCELKDAYSKRPALIRRIDGAFARNPGDTALPTLFPDADADKM